MDTHLGGLLQTTFMEKFREGPYEKASDNVKMAWKMVMLKFLPKICKGWGRKVNEVLLSDHPETTKEMEALVCWYVEMYGESRWEPEHKEDEEKRLTGEKIDRRGKRKGETVRKEGPTVFIKYWKFVKERRAESKDWEQALLDAAKEELSASNVPAAGDNEEESGKPRKKQRKNPPLEPAFPTTYKFTEDGRMIEVAEI